MTVGAIAAVAAFLGATAFIAYALAGYPLLLWLTARRTRTSVAGDFRPEPVTVLLPVHNGAQWLSQKLDSLLALDYPRELLRILVISDGSTDGTDRIGESYSGSGVKLISVAKGGKALAINRGLEHVSSGIVLFTDVRQPLDPSCLRHMIENFSDERIGAVCGELVILDGSSQEELSVGLYWKLEKWIRRQLSAKGSLLVVTGCLYAARRQVLEPLPPNVLGDDIYTPQAILRKGYRIVFDPRARAFDYPTTHDVEFGRKVRTLAGLYQYVRHHGLGPRPYDFFWYKFSRLLLPWALLTIALSSFFLPTPFAVAALSTQAVVYGAAALDPLIPQRTVVKRLSSAARTFCMLMIASARAVSVFFVSPDKLWLPTRVAVKQSRGGSPN